MLDIKLLAQQIDEIGECIVQCTRNCAEIRNDSKQGIIPRGLFWCIIVTMIQSLGPLTDEERPERSVCRNNTSETLTTTANIFLLGSSSNLGI
jgi:hypothetical protein